MSVEGSELFNIDRQVSNLFLSVLDLPCALEKPLPFFAIIPADSYLLSDSSISNLPRFLDSVRVWARSPESCIFLGGKKRDLFPIKLNTVLRIGNDPLKLLARLDGQCEIHCYVEPENRKWLAQIIQDGLMAGIYRENQGWQSVIDLLLNGHNSPVVTSTDCCDQFPNPEIAQIQSSTGKSEEENWNSIRPKDQWELAMWGLREGKKQLELTPDNWEHFYFSDGWDALKLNKLFSIPRSQWSKVIQAYDSCQLPASESWAFALKQLDNSN